MCILWENLISKAPFYYKMMFSKHYKKKCFAKISTISVSIATTL